MTAQILQFDRSLFTPEDVVLFCRVAAGWAQAGLCDMVLRNKAKTSDSLQVFAATSKVPLWSVEKGSNGRYRLIDGMGRRLNCAAAMEDVLRYLELPRDPLRAEPPVR
jgi:hypothetical protein